MKALPKPNVTKQLVPIEKGYAFGFVTLGVGNSLTPTPSWLDVEELASPI